MSVILLLTLKDCNIPEISFIYCIILIKVGDFFFFGKKKKKEVFLMYSNGIILSILKTR